MQAGGASTWQPPHSPPRLPGVACPRGAAQCSCPFQVASQPTLHPCSPGAAAPPPAARPPPELCAALQEPPACAAQRQTPWGRPCPCPWRGQPLQGKGRDTAEQTGRAGNVRHAGAKQGRGAASLRLAAPATWLWQPLPTTRLVSTAGQAQHSVSSKAQQAQRAHPRLPRPPRPLPPPPSWPSPWPSSSPSS